MQNTVGSSKSRTSLKFCFSVLFSVIVLGYFPSCVKKTQTLFSLLPSDSTGIDFKNVLKDSEKFNDFNFRNFYNGGGVAVGDIDHDGLADVIFSSNQNGITLYKNKGNFHFQDITLSAGLKTSNDWTTGVTLADINGDGWLDLYVCHGGRLEGKQRANQLFINDGHGAFKDEADKYGLAFKGYSVQAAFFDFDGDGDLDMFLLNNNPAPVNSVGYRNVRNERDPLGGDRLFRNDGGHFTDVSEQAGIYGSIIGFGMGVTVGDVNGDMLPDIYISNDFHERDYLYINQGNGTFKEDLENQMGHVSESSMGADMADINNDGFPEIFSTDMFPKDDYRLKTMSQFESTDYFNLRHKGGFYNQYMRNMLQLNNGDGTFSEIGELAGVEATDWSWSALIFDMNNDGRKDIFVANGIAKDLTNMDFLSFFSDDETVREITEGKKGFEYKKYLDKIPSTPLLSYTFENQGGYHFKDLSQTWGFTKPSFSNGSAYADLNNDGALDLLVNNVNDPAFVYRNEASKQLKNSFISVALQGSGMNTYGIGSKVFAYGMHQCFYQENEPTRGFQSCTDSRITIGLGKIKVLDSLKVVWPDKRMQTLYNVSVNRRLIFDQKSATEHWKAGIEKASPYFKNISNTSGAAFLHKEDEFSDFNEERLIPHLLSTEGPKMASADVNGDGLIDFFICGALGQPPALFLQTQAGGFVKSAQTDLYTDVFFEGTDALFLDVNHDGFKDLIEVGGGYRFKLGSSQLTPRLFINDGKGHFTRKPGAFGKLSVNASCICSAGNTAEGRATLFIGARCIPGAYGLPPDSYLLEYDGLGNFRDVSRSKAPALAGLGMVCSAVLADVDGDGRKDLVIAGEWMDIKAFDISASGLKQLDVSGFRNTSGLWNTVYATDLNRDGKTDLILGNLGENSKIKGSQKEPARLYVSDFDGNGSADQILTIYKNGKSLPMALKSDLAQQLPMINNRFLKYSDYAAKSVEELFSSDQLASARILQAGMLQSMVFINRGKGRFEKRPLPAEAQFSPVFGISCGDFNRDGKIDLILGGNFYGLKPEYGRYDASYGQIFLGDGKGNFKFSNSKSSGFFIRGQVRALLNIQQAQKSVIVAARNNDSLQVFKSN